jgi:hypothetical protein
VAAPGKSVDAQVAGGGSAARMRTETLKQIPVLTEMEGVLEGVRHASRGDIARGAGRTRGTSGAIRRPWSIGSI